MIQQDVITFSTDMGWYLFLVNQSQLFKVDEFIATQFKQTINDNDQYKTNVLFERYGLNNKENLKSQLKPNFPIHALSLAIAQTCNLGCNYCYAQAGDFGGSAKNMSQQTATAAVKRLLMGVASGQRVNLAFMGGEPLVNRKVLRNTTHYAAQLANKRNIKISYSITTNGTLLTEDDGNFFEQYGFAVTISLDGVAADHDQQRAFKNGNGSYAHIIQRVKPLLVTQRKMQVSARVTVTAKNLKLLDTLQAFIDLGFHSVGFSPMLTAPNGKQEMDQHDLKKMLFAMIACGEKFEKAIQQGRRFPFSNMVNALREIHQGTHRPYPCGAGAGYLGVSADGDLAACHRFVNDERAAMGSVYVGIDTTARQNWLRNRHVDQQQPCEQCWARYLCGGGCHHEVLAKGRIACDYIRDWLRYCLQSYARLIDNRPDYFYPAKHSNINEKTE